MDTDGAQVGAELARLSPREVVLPDVLFDDDTLRLTLEMMDCAFQPQPTSVFDSSRAAENLQRFFGVKTLDGFGQFSRAELAAANGALAYVEKTQIGERPALQRPVREDASQTVYIDAATRANLELVQTLSGEKSGSLLQHLADWEQSLMTMQTLYPEIPPHPLNSEVATPETRFEALAF